MTVIPLFWALKNIESPASRVRTFKLSILQKSQRNVGKIIFAEVLAGKFVIAVKPALDIFVARLHHVKIKNKPNLGKPNISIIFHESEANCSCDQRSPLPNISRISGTQGIRA